MSNHTPGPWTVTPWIPPQQGEDIEDIGLYELSNPPIGKTWGEVDDEIRGNARIMDAALDMLEALKGIVSDDDATTSLADQRARWNARMDAARAAIAKTEEE